jgi:hypothetical protein
MEIGEEFEQIGICNKYPVFFDKESLFYFHEFSRLTFDLAPEESSTIIFRELLKERNESKKLKINFALMCFNKYKEGN